MTLLRAALALVLIAGQAAAQGLPPLPEGLGGPPALPAGLDGTDSQAPGAETPSDTRDSPVTFSGFAELRHAARLKDDPLQGDATLSEARLHIEARTTGPVRLTFAADLLADDVAPADTDLRTGTGAFDLREAHVFFRLGDHLDVRAGRQILTWGTGDLVFVNDLFPKDQVSFFAGRADDYLKAPADAVRVSLYTDALNADLVALAPGQTDRFITGDRLSFGMPPRATLPDTDRPDDWEYALRLYRTFGAVEAALYGYRGHWKSPRGFDDGTLTFPRLDVLGASLRGPLLGGIGWAEAGRYVSRDDADGTDPNIANGETRWLLGYEREIARETTLGLQWMRTVMDDHAAYRAALPEGTTGDDRLRDVATLRLTRLFASQTVTASAFLFHAPADGDGFLRATVDYDVTDNWSVSGTIARFYGDRDTPFGQFTDASSVGLAARYSF